MHPPYPFTSPFRISRSEEGGAFMAARIPAKNAKPPVLDEEERARIRDILEDRVKRVPLSEAEPFFE